jgi:hypothetical protein
VTVDLFAGAPVGDHERALAWYERLLGSGLGFLPNPTEAVCEPAERETCSNGVQKATYRDPDGGEVGSGGVPAAVR